MNMNVLNLYWTLSHTDSLSHTRNSIRLRKRIWKIIYVCMHAIYMYVCMQHTPTHTHGISYAYARAQMHSHTIGTSCQKLRF
jgi:hypothetical protein